MNLRLMNVVVPAYRYTESVVFYRDILGLPVVFESDGCCFVRVGGAQIAIHPIGDVSGTVDSQILARS